MTQEQKAKAYDEAIKRMKSWVRGEHPECFTEAQKAAEFIFPELKESEDEQIRKRIIQSLHGDVLDMEETNKAIAWLEKQGHDGKKWIYEDVYIKEKEQLIQDGIDEVLENPQKYGLEKQKSVEEIVEKCKNSWYNEGKIQGQIEGLTNDEKYQQRWHDALKKQGKPKFKVGDWVVYNRNDHSREILYVYDIRDGRYYFNDNVHLSWSIKECDEKSHLWTIQDAKEGDVLVTKYNRPFIYNGNYDVFSVGAYCGMDCLGEIFIESCTNCQWSSNDNIKPATKEQRDLLFQKMKEAGYEWDSEKKELKKIHVIDEGKTEIDYCFTKMMNGEKVTPAWSEEDEEFSTAIIDHLREYYTEKKVYPYVVDENSPEMKEYRWLKSLKDRLK